MAKRKSLTTSIQGAKLHRKKTISGKELKKQRRLLTALEKTSQSLAIETDVKKILEGIATEMAKALGAKYVNFWDFTPDRKSVFISAAHGMQAQYMDHSKKYPIPVGSAWIGRAVETKQAWATRDITKDPRLRKEIGTWAKPVEKQDYHGLLCLPMMRKNDVSGGMCIYYEDVHDFEYLEMSLATIVSHQAATAVENARIFSELASAQERTENMVKSLYDGLFVQNLNGEVTAFNPRAEELLWVKTADVVGKKPQELKPAENNFFKNVQKVAALDLVEFESKEIELDNPRRRFLEITLVPLKDAQNNTMGSMRVVHDITEEKESEQLKSQFVTVASHQLRTPLSGLRWAFDMLSRGEFGTISKDQLEILQRGARTTENLIKIVNDLLDTSRLEEGRYVFEFQKVNIKDIVSEIKDELEPNIKRQGIDFNIKSVPAAKLFVEADKNKIKMAIFNIIDNAVKYTPKGGAFVEITSNNGNILIVVKDTGIGIAKDEQNFIFNKFFRARNAIKLQTSGSGLGLFIAKEITKHHKGKVWFESALNKGSTFYIQIPKKQPADRDIKR